MSDNQQTLLQLYYREQQEQKLLDKHDLDSDLSESTDYLKVHRGLAGTKNKKTVVSDMV
ncbi:hypothetical protein ITG10_00755 [Vibrio sp. ED004]|uniref:hypothetical protein n=1 Tax=Vibrio sp. ED004 TaxID=2785124 RepID=UPI0020588819|nr:hypothetical protein [Vibrio sp. ED004]UPR58405.1 hypothetical protein ITG10_00755 [Vibrio sp. ED004]